MGYKFWGRKDIERKIVSLGFPEKNLKKFDERKPGFFASLSRDRDEYLDFLQTALLEFASQNDCIIIGRGSFILLKDIPNHISCRFIADEETRFARLKAEFGFDDRAAAKRIAESDSNRAGFHKSFFNVDVTDPSVFHFVMNTALSDIDTIAEMLSVAVKKKITPEIERQGMDHLEELLIGQRLVNLLVFAFDMRINYLRASIPKNSGGEKVVVLHGIADSSAVVERALTIAACEIPEYRVKSEISVVQDFKAYQ